MDGVPKKVYTEFIEALRQTDVSEDVISRLENVLVKGVDLSDTIIKRALFDSEDTDL